MAPNRNSNSSVTPAENEAKTILQEPIDAATSAARGTLSGKSGMKARSSQGITTLMVMPTITPQTMAKGNGDCQYGFNPGGAVNHSLTLRDLRPTFGPRIRPMQMAMAESSTRSTTIESV